MLAPIVMFAYNRPEHLKKTIEALLKNKLIEQSIVYIFIDGAKNKEDLSNVMKVRQYIQDIESEKYFANLTIEFAESNRGLAASIIYGVSKVIEKFGRVIVIEDDVITTNDFLEYMNNSLEFYENEKTIFSIGGFSFLTKYPEKYTADVFLSQRSSSYAWATWKNRWDLVDWNMSDYTSFQWNYFKRKSFNLWGNDRASMLDDQINGRVNSWAIRFDYAMWKNNMYNVLPCNSRCNNIGHDGSGTHSKIMIQGPDPFEVKMINLENPIILTNVEINEEIRTEFNKPFYMSDISLIKRYIGNLFYKNRV